MAGYIRFNVFYFYFSSCMMRLGNSVHTSSVCGWSSRFSTDEGNYVRRLRVQPNDGRPEWYDLEIYDKSCAT